MVFLIRIMVWQDGVITIIIAILSIALIPQITYGFKEKKGLVSYGSSIPTSLGLYVLAYLYFSLGLKLSAAMDLVVAIMWTILLVQRIVYGKV